MEKEAQIDGGRRIARVLVDHGIEWLTTLVGGHISPILVGAKEHGIRVVDVRHEATAVFAADATSRLTGRVGVAAVTAGPGVTNALTALTNARCAQSPLLLLGGATATLLKGRGSLQDIDQLAVIAPHVKWAATVSRVADLAPTIAHALVVARSGVPGPVFVECPVDLLYPEKTVRDWTRQSLGRPRTWTDRALAWYVERHLARQFAPPRPPRPPVAPPITLPEAPARIVRHAAGMLARARRPVLVLGSQAVADVERVEPLAAALAELGAPVYLAGMARGLLGRAHRLQLRTGRRRALGEADLVLVAGLPFDFRLDYGRHIGRRAALVAVNFNPAELTRNRIPDLAVHAEPGRFLEALARHAICDPGRWTGWLDELRQRDRVKTAECLADCQRVDPLELCRELDRRIADDSLLVVDGGDFVATASYLVRPRAPLSWLDPGVFGTLGVGAGFALAAKLARPRSEVWLLYGDGSLGYSLAEFDTFCRHRISIIALVGNDASWAQIARDQVAVLGDNVATVLARTDYERAAEGLGAAGIRIERTAEVPAALAEAKRIAAAGQPVLINAHISTTDFRKGSLSI